MASKKKITETGLLERAGIVVDKLAAISAKRKKLYEEHDELARALKDAPAELLLEHGLELERPFERGNTQFGHGPVREFALRRPKPPKKPRKAAT